MVTTFYPPYHFGGDGIFVRGLARALVSEGHHVEVVHCEDGYRLRGEEQPADQAERDGVVAHRLRSPFGLLSPLITQQIGRPGLKARDLRGILDCDFDVVNFHNISLIGGQALWPEMGEGHMFGVDLVALKLGQPVLAIRCTSGSSHAARR